MSNSIPGSKEDGQETASLSDAEIDQLWLEEAERRLAAYRAGELATIPEEEIFGEE